ncbi:universal stress protein [Streptomyces sp. SudanB182_2057]|uniref:universal stress protein n=1 Tax=Streptomyces sp. SudanB182_2057 TaxID=3035281 RepID=UPI003F55D192
MAIPLVVGVDGSEPSLEAVSWAAAEAARHGLPLHLLHATSADQEASAAIRAACTRAEATAPTVPLSSEVSQEDAASALVDKGRNAFALVLGYRGRGGLVGMLLGSVSLAVAARADCPVIVVRGTPEHLDARFGNVVVGVEDGEGSESAVDFALREAHVRRCRLVAVHACGTTPGGRAASPSTSGFAGTHRRPPAQVLDDALRQPLLGYPDTTVNRLFVEKPGRPALLEAASTTDLLIVGARRRLGHPGLQLGLVNHALLHYSPCPVAVVPQL